MYIVVRNNLFEDTVWCQIFEQSTYITLHVYWGSIFLRFFKNSEAFTLEFSGNLEEMFPRY